MDGLGGPGGEGGASVQGRFLAARRDWPEPRRSRSPRRPPFHILQRRRGQPRKRPFTRSDPQKKEVPPPQIPAIQQKPNLSARDRRKRGFRLPSGSGRSAGGRQMTQSFSTALKLDMPYNMRFSWSGSKSIFQRTGCMLHNLQQASVDPQLNDGVGEGDRGEGGEAAREPASKRTKCCRLFLGMRFIFIFHTSGTIVYILPGFQM
nr:uncharacterized protein LOC102415513 isoform X2 [Bubalus bubalis]